MGTFFEQEESIRPEHRISPEIFGHILAEAESLGVRMIKFTGGEPLFHPLFKDFLKIAADRKLSIIIETIFNMFYIFPS